MTAAANLVVGALVGLCGVAGFLLPMFYTAGLGMSVTEGLALSFAAFILSGALGSFNYKKAGNLDVSFGLRLSAGSMAGAVLGVKLNLIIPEEQVKILLYVVVLLSGISILLRKGGCRGRRGKGEGLSTGEASCPHPASGVCYGFDLCFVRSRRPNIGDAAFSSIRHRRSCGSRNCPV